VQQAIDDRHTIGEAQRAFLCGPWLFADTEVVSSEDARTDAEFETPTHQVIDGDSLLRQLRGRTEDLVGDEYSEPDVRGVRGRRGKTAQLANQGPRRSLRLALWSGRNTWSNPRLSCHEIRSISTFTG
jgi:hypothetical protein